MTTDISLRDYFAATAMRGLLSAPPQFGVLMPETKFARIAYQYADAMLAEREKRERQRDTKETKS